MSQRMPIGVRRLWAGTYGHHRAVLARVWRLFGRAKWILASLRRTRPAKSGAGSASSQVGLFVLLPLCSRGCLSQYILHRSEGLHAGTLSNTPAAAQAHDAMGLHEGARVPIVIWLSELEGAEHAIHGS